MLNNPHVPLDLNQLLEINQELANERMMARPIGSLLGASLAVVFSNPAVTREIVSEMRRFLESVFTRITHYKGGDRNSSSEQFFKNLKLQPGDRILLAIADGYDRMNQLTHEHQTMHQFIVDMAAYSLNKALVNNPEITHIYNAYGTQEQEADCITRLGCSLM